MRIEFKKTSLLLTVILFTVVVVSCSHKFQPVVVDLPSSYLLVDNYSGDSNKQIDFSSGINESNDNSDYDVKNSMNIDSKWWYIFGDTTLNHLIEHALNNNNNALIAFSKIEQARLQFKVDRAEYLPQFSFDISGERSFDRVDGKEEEFIVKPTVSWTLSFFGAMKSSSRAARAEFLASNYNYRAVMLSLAAEVATTYFSLIQYRQSLEISKVTYKNRVKSMTIIDSLLSYGMSTSLDFKQSQGLTATAAAAIPQYERAVAESQNALAILLGENPLYIETTINYRGGDFKSLPADIPAGVPSELLERRPDIMENYANLMAASAKIGIAQAARFPSITLTAGGGLLSSSLKSLVSTDPYAKAWSSLLSITEPLFLFGKLKREEQIAKEAYFSAELAYKESVISALSDVSNALVSNSTLRKEAFKYETLVKSNIDIQQMTSQLYKEGLVDYLNFLDAERTLYSSQLEYSSLLAEYYSSFAKLYLALGGGY